MAAEMLTISRAIEGFLIPPFGGSIPPAPAKKVLVKTTD
jgi:hypothetical protein